MRAKNTRPHTSRRVRKTKPKTPAGSFHHLLHRGDVTPLHLPVIYLPCATASFVFSCTVLFLLTLCLNPRQEKQANLCASSCSLFFSSDGLKRHTAVSSETCGSAKPRGTLGGGGGGDQSDCVHRTWLMAPTVSSHTPSAPKLSIGMIVVALPRYSNQSLQQRQIGVLGQRFRGLWERWGGWERWGCCMVEVRRKKKGGRNDGVGDNWPSGKPNQTPLPPLAQLLPSFHSCVSFHKLFVSLSLFPSVWLCHSIFLSPPDVQHQSSKSQRRKETVVFCVNAETELNRTFLSAEHNHCPQTHLYVLPEPQILGDTLQWTVADLGSKFQRSTEITDTR